MKKLESKEPRRSELQILFMFPPLSVLDQATGEAESDFKLCVSLSVQWILICSFTTSFHCERMELIDSVLLAFEL